MRLLHTRAIGVVWLCSGHKTPPGLREGTLCPVAVLRSNQTHLIIMEIFVLVLTVLLKDGNTFNNQ